MTIETDNRIHSEKMASFYAALTAARRGDDTRPALKNYHRKQLEAIQQQFSDDVTQVRIKTSASDGKAPCTECQKLDGQYRHIDAELAQPSLPLETCEYRNQDHHRENNTGFCYCQYEFIFDESEESTSETEHAPFTLSP